MNFQWDIANRLEDSNVLDLISIWNIDIIIFVYRLRNYYKVQRNKAHAGPRRYDIDKLCNYRLLIRYNIYYSWYIMLLINNLFNIRTWQKSARNIFKFVKRVFFKFWAIKKNQ